MSVMSNVNSENNREVIISITGQFDFSKLQEFRDSYKNYNNPGSQYIVSLSQVEYMDSSALGMILLLKKHAESIGGSIVLQSPNNQVKKILDIANFSQLVNIV